MRDLFFVPRAAVSDHRLSRNDLAVLAALCSFYRHRKPGKNPTRDLLRQLAGLRDEDQVSKATSRLVAFKWITKRGVGGRSGAATYSINWDFTPQNPAISDRVSEGKNPDEFHRVYQGENPVIYDRDYEPKNPVESDRVS